MLKERYSQVILSNMILIRDQDRYLFELREKKDWPGLTLPGGHVEPQETILASVIREAKEETGLTVIAPRLKGIMEWPWENGSRYLAFLYEAESFKGTLKESAEGKLLWLTLKEIRKYPQSQDLDQILKIILTSQS